VARILVVEDNRDIADAVSFMLEQEGHDVRTAYDGASALNEAARHAPQIVVLDIGLPVIDGIEVARRLRDLHGDAVLLIACTGYADDPTHGRLSRAGFDVMLTKPVSLQQLLGALSQAR